MYTECYGKSLLISVRRVTITCSCWDSWRFIRPPDHVITLMLIIIANTVYNLWNKERICITLSEVRGMVDGGGERGGWPEGGQGSSSNIKPSNVVYNNNNNIVKE